MEVGLTIFGVLLGLAVTVNNDATATLYAEDLPLQRRPLGRTGLLIGLGVDQHPFSVHRLPRPIRAAFRTSEVGDVARPLIPGAEKHAGRAFGPADTRTRASKPECSAEVCFGFEGVAPLLSTLSR